MEALLGQGHRCPPLIGSNDYAQSGHLGDAALAPERIADHLCPKHADEGDPADREHEHRGQHERALPGEVEEVLPPDHERGDGKRGDDDRSGVHERSVVAGYPFSVAEANYTSGDDYVVEFLGYRFSFNGDDFEQRVTAAAVRLGLIGGNELEAEEISDLVELAADGVIEEPRSTLGRYVVRHWERISLVEGESLVYWLRKLVFRGAWLDHRVKEGLLEVAWDDEAADFGYRDPHGGRALLELAPVPSWHELQFRR
jgi:hypothetical protein